MTYGVRDNLAALGTTALHTYSPNNGELDAIGTNALRNNLLGLARQTPTGGTTTRYVREPGGTAVSQRVGTSKDFLLPDRLGSTIALATPGGSISRTYTYEPDGTDTPNATGAPQTDLRYAGGHKITTPGNPTLYHYGARYYDPNLARWTQQDPLEQYGDLREANRYAYVGGDPINATDPSGLCFVLHCSTYHSISRFGHRLQTSTRLASGCIAGAELGGAIGTAAVSPEIGAPIGCAAGLGAAVFGGNLGQPELSSR